MHLNQIEGSEFILTKKSVLGFFDGKVDSMGGVCRAKDMKRQRNAK
jgi:hypothetical protein